MHDGISTDDGIMPASLPDNALSRIIQGGDQRYVLHPDSNDKFVRTGRQIIEACQFDIDIRRWTEEVNQLLSRVRQWAEEHDPHIRMVLLSSRNGKLVLFAVPSSDSFDFDLADAIARLTIVFSQDFRVAGYTEMLQIPASDIDRFVDVNNVKVVYVGKQAAAHQSVEA